MNYNSKFIRNYFDIPVHIRASISSTRGKTINELYNGLKFYTKLSKSLQSRSSSVDRVSGDKVLLASSLVWASDHLEAIKRIL